MLLSLLAKLQAVRFGVEAVQLAAPRRSNSSIRNNHSSKRNHDDKQRTDAAPNLAANTSTREAQNKLRSTNAETQEEDFCRVEPQIKRQDEDAPSSASQLPSRRAARNERRNSAY